MNVLEPDPVIPGHRLTQRNGSVGREVSTVMKRPGISYARLASSLTSGDMPPPWLADPKIDLLTEGSFGVLQEQYNSEYKGNNFRDISKNYRNQSYEDNDHFHNIKQANPHI